MLREEATAQPIPFNGIETQRYLEYVSFICGLCWSFDPMTGNYSMRRPGELEPFWVLDRIDVVRHGADIFWLAAQFEAAYRKVPRPATLTWPRDDLGRSME